jgi:hypothetical protein
MKCTGLRWTASDGWTPPEAEMASACQLVVYFGDRRELLSNTPAIEELVKKHPAAKVFGCSSAGEILGDKVFLEGISALCFHFDSATVSHSLAKVVDAEDSRAAGRMLALSLEHKGLRGVFVLSDGSTVNGTHLVEGLLEKLPPNVSLSGGLAGDGDRFGSTVVGVGADMDAGRIVAIGFYGESLDVLCGSAGGWEPFGSVKTITSSEGNVLKEVNGEPALAVYKRYLGARAAELPSAALLFPLEVRTRGPENPGVVRTILSIDDDAQTMTFAGDMPEGASVRLMHAGTDHLTRGARTAAERTVDAVGGIGAAIMVSCVGRRLVLGRNAEGEVASVLDVIGKDIPAAGFYSYGELSPASPGRRSDLHNQTMTLTLFRERPSGSPQSAG